MAKEEPQRCIRCGDLEGMDNPSSNLCRNCKPEMETLAKLKLTTKPNGKDRPRGISRDKP
jgi:hypothetical protein